MLPPLPFTHQDVCDAYPELDVQVPELGQGSFKVAYQALDSGNSRVLKIIYSFPILNDPDNFDFTSVPDRIERELRGMSNVSCAHLVTLLQPPIVRQVGSASYLSYQEPLYAGGTLEDGLQSGAMGEADVRALTIALLRASQALWNTSKIVHRDIKPGNVVFDSDGTPVLLDLGLALFTEMSAITDSGLSSPKTPRYAAPEQFEMRRAVQIDFRTDQYAIGLTALEALLGKHPFYTPGMSGAEYLDALYGFRSSDLDTLTIADDLKTTLGRLLSPSMYGRYRTPESALQALGVTP